MPSLVESDFGEKTEILIAPYIENPYNPGWSRDHPGLYGFSMYGDQKKILKKKIFEKKNFDFFFFFFFLIIF